MKRKTLGMYGPDARPQINQQHKAMKSLSKWRLCPPYSAPDRECITKVYKNSH